jgi:adenine phosphoribosyltransferase
MPSGVRMKAQIRTTLAAVADDRATLDALKAIYERARVIDHQGRLITVNAFTDQIEPIGPEILTGLARLIGVRANTLDYDVVVGEEDKGGHIATAVSLHAWKPLTLARWYVYDLPGSMPDSATVELDSEYFSGRLHINGIARGARCLIVDDTLSTGGTLIALIEAIRRCGGDVAGAVAVVEKIDEGGAHRVLTETGVRVSTLMQIRTTPRGVLVI